MYAAQFKKVTKNYLSFSIDNLDLKIPAGCITGLVGKNGAGKSTLIKLLLSIISPDSGTIEILGDEVTSTPLHNEEIGVVLDSSSFSGYLNAKQIDNIMDSIYKTWDSTRFFKYLECFQIDVTKKVKDYSKGMTMKLQIAVALSHDTKLLILDEATSGLDPVIREQILDILLDFIQSEEHSVLISSHILSDLEKVCDYIAFLHDGKLLFMEEKDMLMEEYGILKCTKEQLLLLDKRDILGTRNNAFMAEALIKKSLQDSLPFKAVVDSANIEEIMIFLESGVNL